MLQIGNNNRLSVIGHRLSQAKSEHRKANTEPAFTLVELLISVAILTFGLVVKIQSYMHSLNGLNASRNYITAMQLAGQKFSELEVNAYENSGLSQFGLTSGSEFAATRQFNWSSEIKEVSEPDSLRDKVVLVCIKLEWKERGIAKDAILSAYLPKSQ